MPDEKQQDTANGAADEVTTDELPEVTDEMLDRYYDYFKHLTTLDVATTVVFLVIARSTPEGIFGYSSLIAFALCLIVALSGMEKSATWLLHPEQTRHHLDFRLRYAGGLLAAGISTFAVWLLLPH